MNDGFRMRSLEEGRRSALINPVVNNYQYNFMQNKAPYKLLLQSNKKPNSGGGGRTQQQIELLSELCINSGIFEYLNLAKNALREICDKLTLIWADNPHATELNQNQLYLILEGKAFDFVLKSRLNQNEQYLMVRKLLPNDFFIVYSPQAKYSQQYDFKKYQLMIDKKTLVGKIDGETYKKYMLPLIEERWKKIVGFLKKVEMLEHIPQAMLYQLSKYMVCVSFPAGTEIINKNQKNHNVYFIVNGEIEYRVFNDVNKRESPSRNYNTIHTKPFKKINLKDNEVFGIDAFNSQTYEEIQMSYSTEAKTNCTLYQIDKRILAIVISSFDSMLPKSNKIWSSVNLNDQIQGQGYQTADMVLLSRNADKIKSSEKRIRDIKLRFYNTSQRSRKNFYIEQLEKKEEELEQIDDVKYQSCQNFSQIKIANHDKNKRFYQTLRPKININSFPNFGDDKAKLNNILISPYDYSQTQIEPQKRQSFTSGTQMHKTSGAFFTKRRSDPNILTGGKEESDIIRSYLQKKLKNEMLKKAELILERNKQKKTKETVKLRRIYSWKSVKNTSGQLNSGKKVGDQLFERMNKLIENPLLSQIEGQRKKLQVQAQRLKETQVKNIRKDEALKSQKQELIIIQNN